MTGLLPINRKRPTLLRSDFDDFGNMLDDFFVRDWPLRRGLFLDTFKLDVQEKEKEYLIEADLPGVEKDEITIEVEDEKLRISVNREETHEEKDKNYIHQERHSTSMQRNMLLEGAKSQGITAKLEHGVLKLVVPKEEKPSTSVKVKVE